MKLIGCSHRIFLREDAKPCVFQFPNKTWGVFQTLVSVVGCVWFPPSHCLKGLEVWRWEGTEVLYNTVPIFSYKACTRAQIGWFLLVNHSKEPLCSSQSDSPAAGHSSTYTACALAVGQPGDLSVLTTNTSALRYFGCSHLTSGHASGT